MDSIDVGDLQGDVAPAQDTISIGQIEASHALTGGGWYVQTCKENRLQPPVGLWSGRAVGQTVRVGKASFFGSNSIPEVSTVVKQDRHTYMKWQPWGSKRSIGGPYGRVFYG